MATKRKNAASMPKEKEKADGDTAQKGPTLLSIPAELRNRIFEEVLVNREHIDISDVTTKPPSLLSTCRQIRGEALLMWYLQNKFTAVVRGCNSDLKIKFNAAYKDLRDQDGEYIKNNVILHCTFIRGARDWPNLLEWCKRIQSKMCDFLPPAAAEFPNYVCVIATAHDVAYQHRGQKGWEECRKVLECLRQAFGRIDQMWLQD